MTLALDHIVIAVHDLEQTMADYGALGFTVLRGGDHPGRSTHNALVVFADGSYLELIAWRAPAPQERWWQLLQRHGEGIVDYALLPPQGTASTVAGAAQRGLQLEGPLDGGRLRPDGERLQWQTARPATRTCPSCAATSRRARCAFRRGRRACMPTARRAWPAWRWRCMTSTPRSRATVPCWATVRT